MCQACLSPPSHSLPDLDKSLSPDSHRSRGTWRREGRKAGGDRRLEWAHPPDGLSPGREGGRAGPRALRTGWEVKLSSAVIDFDSITS